MSIPSFNCNSSIESKLTPYSIEKTNNKSVNNLENCLTKVNALSSCSYDLNQKSWSVEPSMVSSHTHEKIRNAVNDQLLGTEKKQVLTEAEKRRNEFKKISSPELEMLPIDSNCCLFPDIECPQNTVALEKKDGTYLHANLVSVKGNTFCATQYPYQKDSLFWENCFNQGQFIVDLTNGDDLKKPPGLKSYVPTGEQILECGNFKIKEINSESITNKMTCHTYLVTDTQFNQSREIKRFHYQGWQDHQGVPAQELKDLSSILSKEMAEGASNQHPVIHCRAGVGRTGTLITLLSLDKLVNKEKSLTNQQSEQEQKEIVKKIIEKVRQQRGPYCVQTVAQYSAILDTLNLFLKDV